MFKNIIFLSLLSIFNYTFVNAAGSDYEHALSASGGIASPSFSSAAFQNAAGLIYNTTNKFEFHAAANSGLSSGRILPGLIFGNGSAAVTAGLAHVFKSQANAIYYGGAIGLSNKASIGVNGYNFMSPASASSLNAGILFDPLDKTHFGINVVGVSRGVDEIGLGVETSFNQSVQFVGDVTADKKISRFNFQPGIKAGDAGAGITLSYGFGSGSSMQLSDGFTAGVHLMPGQSVSWEIYYRQLGYYFTSLSFPL